MASKDWRLDGLDSDALTRTYTWGLDLSGTFRGAGGIRLRSGSYGGQVRGLLMVDDDTGDGFCGYYAYDGNGNVGQVLDAEDLSTDAHYEYDPYGREIVATGTYADENPWRFSTKYLDILDPDDEDASLLYYGFRHLSPRLGRWLSRDPISDLGSPARRTALARLSARLRHSHLSERPTLGGARWLRARSTAGKAPCRQPLGRRSSLCPDRRDPSHAARLEATRGETAVYAFVCNAPLNQVDAFGEKGIPWGQLLKSGGFLALCRCAGCLAALDMQIGVCAIYFDDVEWAECVCDAFEDSAPTHWLCRSCTFLVGDPVKWAQDYIGCDVFD